MKKITSTFLLVVMTTVNPALIKSALADYYLHYPSHQTNNRVICAPFFISEKDNEEININTSYFEKNLCEAIVTNGSANKGKMTLNFRTFNNSNSCQLSIERKTSFFGWDTYTVTMQGTSCTFTEDKDKNRKNNTGILNFIS